MPAPTLHLPPVTDADIDAAIAPGTGLVAIDFTADWCPPCRMMVPVLDAASQEFASSVRMLQMDSDANPRTTARFNVRGLPSLLVFLDGILQDRIVGAVPLATVRDRFARLVTIQGSEPRTPERSHERPQ